MSCHEQVWVGGSEEARKNKNVEVVHELGEDMPVLQDRQQE